MKHVFIWLIRFYRKHLSGLKSQPTCRFTPTCSSYALQAFEKRGFFVGFLLMWMRIFRCQPFCAGGYDPVPERGLRNPKKPPMPMTKYYYPEEYGLVCEEDSEESKEDTQ